MEARAAHTAHCHSCRKAYDAVGAAWCSCLVTERTLVCPHCGQCFCAAGLTYKRNFWTGAPRELWDRKFAEHRHPFRVPEAPPVESVSRPLVLVVEDEPDIQRVAAHVVTTLGYGMVMATNGAEGLELARRYKPDLVLSDALLPKMDGRDLCRTIKTDPDLAGIKVVVMTALYTSAKHHSDAFRVFRVDDYLAKPVDVERLRAVLQRLLGSPS